MTQLELSSAPIDGPMVPARHRVVAVQRELANTVTLALEPLDTPLALFRAGQFNMLWAFGSGEVPISMSGDAGSHGPLLHTIRNIGASTGALCELESGAVIGVRGPFGSHWDLDSARGGDVVIIGGGIGLAPLRPVVLQALRERPEFRRVTLLVGARSPDDVLYRDQLEDWQYNTHLDVHVTVDHAGRHWRGDVGVVTALIRRIGLDPNATVAFVCGPEIMMRLSAAELLDHGVPAGSIHVSLERNMKCAIAQCGHCQLGPTFVCREGPVYPYDIAGPLMAIRGL